MEIDTNTIETELKELAGKERVKVKLAPRMDVASSIRQTDKGFVVRLNPKRLKTPTKLESHLNMCRENVGR